MFYLDRAKRQFQKYIIEYHRSIAKGEDVKFVINKKVIDYLKEFDSFYQINIKFIMGESTIVDEKYLKNREYFSILKTKMLLTMSKLDSK